MAVAVHVVGIGEHDRVPGAVGQQPAGRHVWLQVAVEETRVHVHVGVVGQVVLHVEYEHRVGDVDAVLDRVGEEPINRHTLATQVALRVGRGHLNRVHAGFAAAGVKRLGAHGLVHVQLPPGVSVNSGWWPTSPGRQPEPPGGPVSRPVFRQRSPTPDRDSRCGRKCR